MSSLVGLLAGFLEIGNGLPTNCSVMTVLQAFVALVGKTLVAFSFALAGVKVRANLYTLIVVSEVTMLIFL